MENLSDAELIIIGKKALERERGELIDNCYRARLIPFYEKCSLSLEELKTVWTNYLKQLQRGQFS